MKTLELTALLTLTFLVNLNLAHAEKLAPGEASQRPAATNDGIDGSYVAYSIGGYQRGHETFDGFCHRVKREILSRPPDAAGKASSIHVQISGSKIAFDDCDPVVSQAYSLKRAIQPPGNILGDNPPAEFDGALEVSEESPPALQACWKKMGGKKNETPLVLRKGRHFIKRCAGFLFIHNHAEGEDTTYHILSSPPEV